MFSHTTKAHSVRYTVENQPQTAWTMAHLAAAISELQAHGRAVVAVALAFQYDDVVSEEFMTEKSSVPLAGGLSDQVCRLFQQEISRELEEDWAAFVQRSGSAASAIAGQLSDEVKNATDLSLPPEYAVLFRLSWCSEIEWQQYYGLNLLKLIDGSRSHPEVGQDVRGITYLFKYPDQQQWHGQTQNRQTYVIERHTTPEASTGRRLFDLAETLCAQMEQVQQEVSQFMVSEWKKKLPEEVIAPAIVNVTFHLNAAGKISVIVSLNDENPDNEPLYQYWKVELEEFSPVRLQGYE